MKRAYRITGFLARLLAVLENVFAAKYSDHLGGINRVLDSDVAVGERLSEKRCQAPFSAGGDGAGDAMVKGLDVVLHARSCSAGSTHARLEPASLPGHPIELGG